MSHAVLERGFARIRARLRVVDAPSGLAVDVLRDSQGELFELKLGNEATAQVVDSRPDLRHLLLLVRNGSDKLKYLCGHDERHWFAAAVPNDEGLHSVEQAMESLKPRAVRARQGNLKPAARLRRKNDIYIRQGEWFFLPMPMMEVDDKLVHRNELLSRGNGSKPHMCQFAYRQVGEQVYVHSRFPQGLRENDYRVYIQRNKSAARWKWSLRYRSAGVFVRGMVRHPDHKTIYLRGWHQVFMNRENEAPGKQHLAFLD